MKNNFFALTAISSALFLTGCGGSGSDSTPEVTVNQAPKVSLTSLRVNENSTVTIPSNVSDSDGTIVSYQWKVVSNDTITLTGANTSTVGFTAPGINVESYTLTLELTVTDDDGATATAGVNVTVDNLLPSVSFESVMLNERESAEVIAVSDPSGDQIATYDWQITSGDSDLVLANNTSATLSFTAPELDVDKTYELTLTATDIDGDTATFVNEIAVNRITMPLTISGLATDSPIRNAQISVNVGGRDVTVDATADAEGNYTVDLELDESESDAFISIIAKGVGEQKVAGLISLLGTAGQLIENAGDDSTLTSDESFSVNVTNITTAEYALVKLANKGNDVESSEQLDALKQEINYEEVMVLATAIKVAIDKVAANPDLAIPDNIEDTLALVESSEQAAAYVAKVVNEPVFEEAQEEIYADEKLIDKSASDGTPSLYYVLPQTTLQRATIARFNEDGTGSYWNRIFTWEDSEGVITATITDPEIVSSVEYFDDEYGYSTGYEVETSVVKYEFKRLNQGEKQDLLAISQTQNKHFPNGEKADIVEVFSDTYTAAKVNAVKAIANESGVAYLPLSSPTNNDSYTVYGDEVTLSEGGTASFTVLGYQGTWSMAEGALVIDIPSESKTFTYKNVGERGTSQLFSSEVQSDTSTGLELAHEFDYVGEGNINTEQLNWSAAEIPGVYVYSAGVFDNEFEHFFFQLHENGNAETISTVDIDDSGSLEPNEISIMYGTWMLNNDGTVTITRYQQQGGGYSQECREEKEGCALYHERTWRLIGIEGDEFSLFHKHHFRYQNVYTDWEIEDFISFDNRKLLKRDSVPVEYEEYISLTEPEAQRAESIQSPKSDQLKKLEPSLD